MSRYTACQCHGRLVRVIRRIENDDFVARPHERLDGAENAFGRARAHGDFLDGVHVPALQSSRLVGDNVAQVGDARHRRVLVAIVFEVPRNAVG